MFDSNKILILARQANNLHPQSTLIDFYKLFFQGSFGPGHFIPDIISAIDFLYQELHSSQNFEDHFYQKIDYHQTFYRVNLVVMKMNLISFNDFYSGFIASGRFKANISMEQWVNEWQQIELILKNSSLKIHNFENDSQDLQQLFSKEDYVTSHSLQYRNAYNPHYRLFNQTEFDKLNINGKSCNSYIYQL